MNISWTECFDLTQQMTQELQEARLPSPCYVLIGRGGLAMGMMMTRFTPLWTVLYIPLSKMDPPATKPVQMYRRQWAGPLGSASHVVLVDDIYDTGHTIEMIADDFLSSGSVRGLMTMTLLTRSERKFRRGVHLYGKNINTAEWVYFPWEMYDPIQHTEEVPF